MDVESIWRFLQGCVMGCDECCNACEIEIDRQAQHAMALDLYQQFTKERRYAVEQEQRANRNGIIARVLGLALLVLTGIVLAASLGGCHTASPPVIAQPKAPPLSQAVPQIDESVQRSNAALARAYEAVKGMTLETFAAVKPVVLAFIAEAQAANVDTTKKIGVAVESVKADAKADAAVAKVVETQKAEIVQLKAADPVRSWLRWIGGGLMLGAIAVIIASFFYVFIAAFRPLAVTAGVVGAVAVTLAQYLPLIESVIAWALAAAGVACLALLGWYAWIHQKDIVAWKVEEKAVGTLTEVAAQVQTPSPLPGVSA